MINSLNPQRCEDLAVIAILKGGLGNQFFIYAAARALALRTGRVLYLDTTRGYTHDTYNRGYRLDRLPIVAKPMPEKWRVALTLKHPQHKFIRAWNQCLPRNRRTYLAEDRKLPPSQLSRLDPAQNRLTLFGYWQDERYFVDHAECILAELAPPEPLDERNRKLGKRFASQQSVSIHIRRARYPEALPKEYYQNALGLARRALHQPNFVIFGDDPEWALETLNFDGSPVEVVEHNLDDELADLWLLGRCRHAVTANSTFSWWGAWLAGPASSEHRVWTPAESGLQLLPAAGWDLVSWIHHRP